MREYAAGLHRRSKIVMLVYTTLSRIIMLYYAYKVHWHTYKIYMINLSYMNKMDIQQGQL